MSSEIEILIHQHLMGGCIHLDFKIIEERSFGHMSKKVVCVDCGISVFFPFRMSSETAPTSGELLACLKDLIPPHCLDIITTRRVLRHLETQGWRWSRLGRDGKFQFTLERGNHRVVGEPSQLEHVAIASVIAQLARQLSVA